MIGIAERPTILLLLGTIFSGLGESLRCIQCPRSGRGQTVNSTLLKECLAGRVPPTPCKQSHHSHCIAYTSRESYSGQVTVLWRDCGTAKDVMCKKHYIPVESLSEERSGTDRNRIQKSEQRRNQRKRQQDYVEVCQFGCRTDGCLMISAGNSPTPLIPATMTALFAAVFLSITVL